MMFRSVSELTEIQNLDFKFADETSFGMSLISDLVKREWVE